ncbi:hypothetical protein C1N70_03270 [Cytobacillus firmus]
MKIQLQSPNLEHLRTENAEIRGTESEPGATSDTKSENPASESEPGVTSDIKSENSGFRVRIRFTFLQNEQKSRE